MSFHNLRPTLLAFAVALLASRSACGQPQPHVHTDGVKSEPKPGVHAAFDIVHTKITTDGNVAVFEIAVSGQAGTSLPTPTGALAGSRVFSYVWPTTMDPSIVGFDSGSGILAFAVTAHPDFDDTPLFDENADGNLQNDGNVWHSHWVVLTPDASCGQGKLKVVDIPTGTKPHLPRTWPGLPILIDSPGWSPTMSGSSVRVRVPFDDIGAVTRSKFDGVTAALRVNASVHSPLLCIENVFKVASGNLSLPGQPNR